MKIIIDVEISDFAREAITFLGGAENLWELELASKSDVENWIKKKIGEDINELLDTYKYSRNSLNEISSDWQIRGS